MKTSLIIFLSLILWDKENATSEYDISNLYSSIEPDSGTKVLTSNGDLETIDYILTPTRIETGKYKVSVTKKAKDLYKIDGKNIFIETKYCYEYATREEVILIIESGYGISKGKIIF